jgi:protein transport protein SEC24
VAVFFFVLWDGGKKATLPLLENQFSQRVNAIIGKIRESRRGAYYPHLYVVKEDGEPSLRIWALSLLVEDRQDALPSYHQYINALKDKVCFFFFFFVVLKVGRKVEG